MRCRLSEGSVFLGVGGLQEKCFNALLPSRTALLTQHFFLGLDCLGERGSQKKLKKYTSVGKRNGEWASHGVIKNIARPGGYTKQVSVLMMCVRKCDAARSEDTKTPTARVRAQKMLVLGTSFFKRTLNVKLNP